MALLAGLGTFTITQVRAAQKTNERFLVQIVDNGTPQTQKADRLLYDDLLALCVAVHATCSIPANPTHS